MNDTTVIHTTHTKKYNIPLSHIDHRYIELCTDESELDRIYKELRGGQEGAHPILEQLTLDRIRDIQSNILQQETTNDNDNISTPTVSVINNNVIRSTPKSDEEWNQLQHQISREFNSDNEDEVTDSKSYETNKRLHRAEQHRLNADTAFKLKNYQQSIELYTNSLSIENNLIVYLSRAVAYLKVDNFDAAIEDYSKVLAMDSKNIEALLRRAVCYGTKGQFDEAKRDIDSLLIIDPGNNDAQEILHNLLTTPDVLSTYDKSNQLSSLNDDDDMALGDEAGGDLHENISDEEGQVSRSINVSPNMDDDADIPELITQKSLQTPPLTPKTNIIDQSIASINENNSRHNSYNYDPYDRPSINYASFKLNTVCNSRMNNNDSNMTIDDAISNSNFGFTIQNWLRDFVKSQPSHRMSSYYDRPWSKSHIPWSLEKMQRDIEQFNRFSEYTNAIEVSKKMLQNGILDYHYHAEYIVNTLLICADCYLNLNDHIHAIQYATEALQYNKTDVNTLICRAKAFAKEGCSLFSYADYSRVPKNIYSYHLTQRALDQLTITLNSTEGETWREKLIKDENDDYEHYLTYLKTKTEYSEENSYEWYRTYADQLYLDGCFVLAIQFYTNCIKLQPTIAYSYIKRAASYLKVSEPQKALDDCDIVLKEDPNNILALYRKASAHKMLRNDRLYESTLKEYIKFQPNNQIILAEYYSSRHEQIPRKKRRIRNNENILSYEELEQIRLEKIFSNLSLDSNDIKNQCLVILHLTEINIFQLTDSTSIKKLIEIIINISQLMIQAEEKYQQDNKNINLNFSYIKHCFDILVQLTKLEQIDVILSMIDDNYRLILNQLIDYYSKIFNDVELLNPLKTL